MVKAYIFALIFLLLGYNNVYSQKDQSINHYQITIEEGILVDLSQPDQTFKFGEKWGDSKNVTYAWTRNEKSNLYFTFSDLKEPDSNIDLKSYKLYSMTDLLRELKEFIKKTIVAPDYALDWKDQMLLELELPSLNFSNVYVKMPDDKIYHVKFQCVTVISD
ncbi:hypothetical protein [Myroides marinus]|uniref:hypothetical protein n=1 Tax=Myroides marinus TaxID=703342 RepID=UPI002576FACF|nr:hypothetical protein [Myroides marinus]MDM1353751.1 hypothetical protein [Myroides marinus]